MRLLIKWDKDTPATIVPVLMGFGLVNLENVQIAGWDGHRVQRYKLVAVGPAADVPISLLVSPRSTLAGAWHDADN